MRLLQRLPGSSDFSLVERFGEEIPPYAILSHTWGSDEDEVTFTGLQDAQSKQRSGYFKLLFCLTRAAKDKIQFFWVDTCCIDKSSSAELSEAINSMFKWYERAEKCYVLLSDVEVDKPLEDSSQANLTQIFQDSRWFRRGWTLQEMLAPRIVEFFSKNGTRLGDKETLLQTLHSTTRIPTLALQGTPLRQFSVSERMSWMKGRQTKREEDVAYSLLGLLGVHMPLLYGEGRSKALARLRHEAENLLDDRAPSKSLASRPWTVPFRRLNDFNHSDHLERVYEICSQPSGWATLTGPAGSGKTQVAVEYAYRVKDETPRKWVFWIDAATRASFQESYKQIAVATGINYFEKYTVDTMVPVRRWLCAESNGQWTMVIDNAEDANIFFSYGKPQNRATTGLVVPSQPLHEFLPKTRNGSILVMTRDRGFTQRLMDINTDNVNVELSDCISSDSGGYSRNKPSDSPEGIDVASQEDTTLHSPSLTSGLPMPGDKTTQYSTHPNQESEVSTGKVSVFWKSRGERMCEEYVEIGHGAAAELEKTLRARYTPSGYARTAVRAQSWRSYRFPDVFRWQGKRGHQRLSNAEHADYELQALLNTPNPVGFVAASEQIIDDPEGELLRLLVCMPNPVRRWQKTLFQVELGNISDDRELFHHLRKQYIANGKRSTFKQVKSVSLAKFAIDYNNRAHVYSHDSSCQITNDGQFDRALGFYCTCLPQEWMVGHDKEYVCSPAPKSPDWRLMPVLGPIMLMRDFLDPDAIATGQTTVFDQLPKRRLREKLKGTPGGERVTGWGLYIEESEESSGTNLITVSVVVMVAFILFTGITAVVLSVVQYWEASKLLQQAQQEAQDQGIVIT